MKNILAIIEDDLSDNSTSIIGLASTNKNALKMIKEYYGENEYFSEPRMIQDSGLEFDLCVEVKGKFGGRYRVTAMYYDLDSL